MDTTVVIAIVVALVLALGIGLWLYSQQQHKKETRNRFGPEYDRTVRELGGEREAQKELDARQQRMAKLHITDLTEDQQRRFADQWHLAQAHFVDEPKSAIGEADNLVMVVMDARGYPVNDFEQQAADVSVEHPNVVENYRSAHAIAEKSGKDGASTEELRQAMIHYRSLFDELLGTRQAAQERKVG